MQWTPSIHCIGNLKDTLSNNIPNGQADVCQSAQEIAAVFILIFYGFLHDRALQPTHGSTGRERKVGCPQNRGFIEADGVIPYPIGLIRGNGVVDGAWISQTAVVDQRFKLPCFA